MYNSEHPKLLRNTTPIRDPEVISFVKKTATEFRIKGYIPK